jgi:aspartate 1-decarboxylase
MFRRFLRAYIPRATVTGTCPGREGSLTVDQDLLDAAGILPYETILCSNASNGDQFLTYVIEGKRRGGEITLNGPIARKGAKAGSPPAWGVLAW